MSVKVISYNLLSTKLCNYLIPEDLDATITLLENFIKFSNNPQPIICLQEISPDWKGDFELLFMKHDSSFFNISYGILGIGIEVPNVELIKTGK